MNKKIVLFLVLAFLAIRSETRAQFVWQTSKSDNDWRYDYRFTSLSCNGDNCTVSIGVWDKLELANFDMFLRTTDGGLTWKTQDPMLPPKFGTSGKGKQSIFKKIQQIDSLNIVSVGNSGLIFRTFDGGQTWEHQTCGSTLIDFTAVHFSDPQTGIISGNLPGGGGAMFTTINGGKDWTLGHFTSSNTLAPCCRSLGGGKFRVMSTGRGPVYTTNDSWQTAISSKNYVDSSTDSMWQSYSFAIGNLTGGDTIFAGGWYQSQSGAIVRSTDGGNSWEKPIRFDDYAAIVVDAMTPVIKDTIFAWQAFLGKILISTDRGQTWQKDSMVFDTLQEFSHGGPLSKYLYDCSNLEWTPHGVLAIISEPSLLARWNSASLSVHTVRHSPINEQVYPNPASSEVFIKTNLPFQRVAILDILGRTILEGILSDDGSIDFEIRQLPNGIYTIVAHSNRENIPLGKFIKVQE
jgi:photosystem II stability/assembly factor-like uncharacterized protein